MDRRTFLVSGAASAIAGGVPGAMAQQMPAATTGRRAIGVNCFDLFNGPLLGNSSARMASTRLRELRMAGIPFVRFAASPFWPVEWKGYMTDSRRYFSFLDAVVEAAEVNQLGLVPSLFWNPVSVSDLVGEPVSDWGKSGSKTREFMATYVEQVVRRYRNSNAIWIWEFGNEFNIFADLPNALKWWPSVNVMRGTPPQRTIRDLIRSADCASIFGYFATHVRKHDDTRFISSGSDLPRPNAFNLVSGNWLDDSPEQFRLNLQNITPDPLNTISVHLYQKAESKYFRKQQASYPEILGEVAKSARDVGKPVFVGEFGVPLMEDPLLEQREFARILASIVAADVRWAALWVYDFAFQRADWNINLTGSRAYQLIQLAEANSRL